MALLRCLFASCSWPAAARRALSRGNLRFRARGHSRGTACPGHPGPPAPRPEVRLWPPLVLDSWIRPGQTLRSLWFHCRVLVSVPLAPGLILFLYFHRLACSSRDHKLPADSGVSVSAPHPPHLAQGQHVSTRPEWLRSRPAKPSATRTLPTPASAGAEKPHLPHPADSRPRGGAR